MRQTWLANLLSFFLPLVGIKLSRLTGPTTNKPDERPSRNFTCLLDPDAEGVSIKIETKAVECSWISQSTRGISMQKVYERNGEYRAGEKPIRNEVTVSPVRPNCMRIRGATPEIQKRLANGVGPFSLVTSKLSGNQFIRDKAIIIDGDGNGKWKIR